MENYTEKEVIELCFHSFINGAMAFAQSTVDAIQSVTKIYTNQESDLRQRFEETLLQNAPKILKKESKIVTN